MPRSIFGYSLTLVFLVLSPPTAAQAQEPCDAAIDVNVARRSGYQDRSREDAERAGSQAPPRRCEGIYVPRVQSFGVRLLALTAVSMSGELCLPGQAVHLVWPRAPTGAAQPVRLRMASLRHNFDYELDTTLPRGSSSYQWPASPRCNNDVRLRGSEAGGVATVSLPRADGPVDVLLPVAIAADRLARAVPPYRAVLAIGPRARAVFVSLSHYGPNDELVSVFSERLLQRQAYLANGRIQVELSPSELKVAGLYRLKASVHFEQNRRAAVESLFLHAP